MFRLYFLFYYFFVYFIFARFNILQFFYFYYDLSFYFSQLLSNFSFWVSSVYRWKIYYLPPFSLPPLSLSLSVSVYPSFSLSRSLSIPRSLPLSLSHTHTHYLVPIFIVLSSFPACISHCFNNLGKEYKLNQLNSRTGCVL